MSNQAIQKLNKVRPFYRYSKSSTLPKYSGVSSWEVNEWKERHERKRTNESKNRLPTITPPKPPSTNSLAKRRLREEVWLKRQHWNEKRGIPRPVIPDAQKLSAMHSEYNLFMDYANAYELQRKRAAEKRRRYYTMKEHREAVEQIPKKKKRKNVVPDEDGEVHNDDDDDNNDDVKRLYETLRLPAVYKVDPVDNVIAQHDVKNKRWKNVNKAFIGDIDNFPSDEGWVDDDEAAEAEDLEKLEKLSDEALLEYNIRQDEKAEKNDKQGDELLRKFANVAAKVSVSDESVESEDAKRRKYTEILASLRNAKTQVRGLEKSLSPSRQRRKLPLQWKHSNLKKPKLNEDKSSSLKTRSHPKGASALLKKEIINPVMYKARRDEFQKRLKRLRERIDSINKSIENSKMLRKDRLKLPGSFGFMRLEAARLKHDAKEARAAALKLQLLSAERKKNKAAVSRIKNDLERVESRLSKYVDKISRLHTRRRKYNEAHSNLERVRSEMDSYRLSKDLRIAREASTGSTWSSSSLKRYRRFSALDEKAQKELRKKHFAMLKRSLEY